MEAHFRIIERALDDPKRVLNLGSELGSGVFNFATQTTDQTLLIVLFMGVGPRRNRPDHLITVLVLWKLVHARVTCITRLSSSKRLLWVQAV